MHDGLEREAHGPALRRLMARQPGRAAHVVDQGEDTVPLLLVVAAGRVAEVAEADAKHGRQPTGDKRGLNHQGSAQAGSKLRREMIGHGGSTFANSHIPRAALIRPGAGAQAR
jgi:hypothetical protein